MSDQQSRKMSKSNQHRQRRYEQRGMNHSKVDQKVDIGATSLVSDHRFHRLRPEHIRLR